MACRARSQRWVEIRVCDTGKGIPAEDVTRIFDKFYQSSYHRQEKQQGTGLGLTIARHIVEAHGGKIWAESQVGRGSNLCCDVAGQSQRDQPHAGQPGHSA